MSGKLSIKGDWSRLDGMLLARSIAYVIQSRQALLEHADIAPDPWCLLPLGPSHLRRCFMPLSHQDVRNILNILDHAEHLEAIDLRIGDFQLQARKPGALRQETETTAWPMTTQPGLPMKASASAEASMATSPLVVQAELEVPAGMVPVCAPLLGTFYARPSPDQPPFVEVGATVQAHDTVGLVEVMKMFNSVKAGVAGTVQRVVAESGKPVQQGQILLLIAPTPQDAPTPHG
jgi:acetyl-CoA carboxylase biotin carboxyl carrier protein